MINVSRLYWLYRKSHARAFANILFAEFLSLQVPHSLTLMEQYDLLCIADRENMRVICVKAELKDYNSDVQISSLNIQQPDFGRVFAIAAHGIGSNFYIDIMLKRRNNRYVLK